MQMQTRRITAAPDRVRWVGPMNAAEAILMNMTMDGRLSVGRCAGCKQLRLLRGGWDLVVPHPESDRPDAAECAGSGQPPAPLVDDEDEGS